MLVTHANKEGFGLTLFSEGFGLFLFSGDHHGYMPPLLNPLGMERINKIKVSSILEGKFTQE